MGRFIATIYVILGVAAGVAVFYTRNPVSFAAPARVPEQPAAVASAGGVTIVATSFGATGTLVFYPNNVGPVPYIFYQDGSGRTVSKALTFPAGSPADFSSWSGAHISVTGTLDQEHVIVSRITYLSGP